MIFFIRLYFFLLLSNAYTFISLVLLLQFEIIGFFLLTHA